MREVAKLAGVSHQTVSRVINGHPSIRPATRDRVMRVIKETNYRPNIAARALATRRSARIGVLIDSAMAYGPNSTVRAVEEFAREAGYSVSSITVSNDRAISPNDALEHLMAQVIDALCIVAPRASSVDLLRTPMRDLPTLVVKAEPDDSFLTASVDQVGGAALAVDHLIGLGHQRILHLAGPLDWFDSRGRLRGWQASVAKAGLEELPAVEGDWTADFGYQYALALPNTLDFTAVFAANDQMALGLLHGLRERGIRVPDDVSVVGFDDLPETRHFSPPLTTVSQDFQALGRRSVEVLLAALHDEEPPGTTVIAPELIVRESTSAPRSL